MAEQSKNNTTNKAFDLTDQLKVLCKRFKLVQSRYTDITDDEFFKFLNQKFTELIPINQPPVWTENLNISWIDWHQLLADDIDYFQSIEKQIDENNFKSLYFLSSRNQIKNNLAQWLDPNSSFINHLETIAKILQGLIDQDRYILRIRPENFRFIDQQADIEWGKLEQQSFKQNEKQIKKFELGWMHSALRHREIPQNFNLTHAVTHSFCYLILYILTQLPKADGQASLSAQIDGFRAYTPQLPPELRDFFRNYLSINSKENHSPIECFHALKTILEHCSKHNEIQANIQIAGDSVYGRRKQNNDNEDVFFYERYKNCALLGVADGVSTATIGTGGTASYCIKEQFQIKREYWASLLNDLDQSTNWFSQAEKIINEFFENAQSAVLEKINAFKPDHMDDELQSPMSSTLVLAVVKNNQVLIGHWGDSRAYKITSEKVIRLTEDHNKQFEHLRNSSRNGAIYSVLNDGDVLTRVVGTCEFNKNKNRFDAKNTKISFDQCQLGPHDYLLLASDGLLGSFSASNEKEKEAKLFQLMMQHYQKSNRELARHLVLAADSDQGNDNITALLLKLIPTDEYNLEEDN